MDNKINESIEETEPLADKDDKTPPTYSESALRAVELSLQYFDPTLPQIPTDLKNRG